ncbi:ImmA/IrrE family metallo-endopeptidase [Gordonia sp. (in: high G+C Gram-positive bacteria)]|uniref:ImmA/IrrE family metallo-endopeptidase n=1 Tax=Gordonia sp. (in: high G+C Gram-positive bacteria) TaxID=84139 RepID=UPI0016A0477E|nr:ImmA/IrrE family metallo-endopeptidase [Gordonia sp. (in: high G+C Gram-positive bacteria)]NLG47252.1 ImmA/IrrE family metallo-endopeptidase [Gordonia sp. (in: high G+C Gram-positive bacteria)]
MSDPSVDAARPRRSHRRIHAAVEAVLDVAAQKHAGTLEEIVTAVGESRRRPITVSVEDLAPGVWGQRREYDDHDEIVLARSLPSEARTLAHELGHVIFKHPGAAADTTTVAAEDDLIAYMLGITAEPGDDAVSDADHDLHEWEAEAFASRLLQRLGQLYRRRSWRPMLRYDEALG